MAGINNPIINNIASLPNTAFDTVVENLRAKLAAELPWLERSFGRCYRLPKERTNDNTVILPHYYLGPGNNGQGEYMTMEPNDDLRSMSFILGDDDAFTPLTDLEPFAQVQRWTKPIRIIFFVNYQRIFDQDGIGGQYPFSEILIRQVQNVLWNCPGLVLTGYVSETINAVYEGFDLSEMQERLLYYPYGAFRIDAEQSYDVSCIGPATIEQLVKSFQVGNPAFNSDWESNHLISPATDPGDGTLATGLTYVDAQGNPCTMFSNHIRVLPGNEYRAVFEHQGLFFNNALDGFFLGTDTLQYGDNAISVDNMYSSTEMFFSTVENPKQLDITLTNGGDPNIVPPAFPDSVFFRLINVYRRYPDVAGWWDNWSSNIPISVNWNWLSRSGLVMLEIPAGATGPFYIEFNTPLNNGSDYRITGGAALNRNDNQAATGIVVANAGQSVTWVNNNNIGIDTFFDFDVTMTADADGVLRVFARDVFGGTGYTEPPTAEAAMVVFSEITITEV